MNTFLLKSSQSNVSGIKQFIEEKNGAVVYSSPYLPILGISVTDEVKLEIENTYELDYIFESANGYLQDVEGSLTAVQKNPIKVLPSLDFHLLRNLNYTGWGASIAILDSGVNADWISEHFDFSGYGSTPGVPHGTIVANIIKKAAPGAKIYSYKVCHDHVVKQVNVLKAIDEAVKRADIINISIGFANNCTASVPCTLCEVINFYTQRFGKLFVVSAGNAGQENSISCPGKSQESITVGAIKTQSLVVADYSSKGVSGIIKPNILTSGTVYYNNEYSYGTSYAAPIITGTCAAIFTKANKDISNIKQFLYSSTRDLGAPEHHQGFGLLDLEKLLEVVENDTSSVKSEGQKQS